MHAHGELGKCMPMASWANACPWRAGQMHAHGELGKCMPMASSAATSPLHGQGGLHSRHDGQHHQANQAHQLVLLQAI